MKRSLSAAFFMLVLTIMMSSCAHRSNPAFMDDTRTASRHVARGLKVLWGMDGESRMIRNRQDFEMGDDYCYVDADDLDFVPLKVNEKDQLIAVANTYVPQSKKEAGEKGSRIPGIEHFRDPSTLHGMADVFHNITYPLDSSVVKGDKNVRVIKNIADYMGKNPNLYVFVEGHCDERGAEAYNLSLGSRRANGVRKMLVDAGVDPDRIFTVSYGKERPFLYGHDEVAWTQNRRVEFKVFQHN